MQSTFSGGSALDSPDRVSDGWQRRVDMKKIAVALLLVFGVSVTGSVFACDGNKHGKSMSGTSAPAAPTPAPAK
jgi:hypothetical protein